MGQVTIMNNPQMINLGEFFQSNKLVGQVMAMIAESRVVKPLLDELLGSSGCNVAVLPASIFAKPDECVSFWHLTKRALTQNAILIGYQRPGPFARFVVNPP